ncbi:thiamine monophosphate synthase/TENI [Sphingobacterium spiritivorum ATCC 33300]|uniref:Thiamine monophosphate synthase/TENI n=1 Tax=Sphingobacterium spiritivorum ATCC 33300 TaxID=525372 RepID=C2FVT2_SPHSI|nr:thiamine phosphate synthase [Sphingobacterium spiritivorum]EEI92924.1 thiamine monophosphate synthase/TENI [Sphingobacterium spiritivorum ATCC 33300]QQS96276.1 thiamine phosphate synthase [Sphingobacterium spiritivorum]
MIIISPDTITPQHIELIHAIPWSDALLYHLRLPSAAKDDIAHILEDIDKHLYPFIVLHYHKETALKAGIRRIHISTDKKKEISIPDTDLILSVSTHHVDEFNSLDADIAYAFISPVYPSISKEGYQATAEFKIHNIQHRSNLNSKMIALGGITEYNISELKALGYDDVALCGYIWQHSDPLFAADKCFSISQTTSYVQ